MVVHLPYDIENALRAEVLNGHFASVDDAVIEAVRSFLREASMPKAEAKAVKPIWEEILEITAGIPEEELKKLPVDGAEQHDHYIYGIPKRPTV